MPKDSLTRAAAALSILMGGAAPAMAKDFVVTVSAPNRDYREAPVRITVPAPKDFAGVALMENGAPVPAQARLVDGKAEVTWLVRDLKKGGSRSYRLAYERIGRGAPASGVIIDRKGADLEIRINNELFTRYDATTGPNKPYFYPIFGPDNRRITRGFPIENLPEDVTKDHPHHRGLWFTHGEVNGEDYWSEGPKAAKTVNVKYEEVTSGPVCGYFRAKTEWISREGENIAEDTREVRVYNTSEGRLMDFDVTVKAIKPLEFGDTKEGSMGIRIADSMRVTIEKNMKGEGHIETSAGIKDAAAWGTRAEWVDYYGPVGGGTVGLTILDNPANFRHPAYWHVRDYGLFAVNPFGIHDFVKNQPKDAGVLKIAEGQSQAFRYRLYFHKGTTTESHVADVWGAYSDPPKVEVR